MLAKGAFPAKRGVFSAKDIAIAVLRGGRLSPGQPSRRRIGHASAIFERRGLLPAPKRVAKIRGLAEPERVGDVVDRHLRVAQIFDRDFRSQLVEDVAKRSLLLLQFAP